MNDKQIEWEKISEYTEKDNQSISDEEATPVYHFHFTSSDIDNERIALEREFEKEKISFEYINKLNKPNRQYTYIEFNEK